MKDDRIKVGSQIKAFIGSPGTLGCIVEIENEDGLYILSCAHILTSNNVFPYKGRSIFYAQGNNISGKKIGNLSDWEYPNKWREKNLDAAIAKTSWDCVTSEFKCKNFNSIDSNNPITKEELPTINSGEEGMPIKMCSSTYPEPKKGKAFYVEKITLDYGLLSKKLITFKDVIKIKPIMGESFISGDSGSLIVTDSDNKPRPIGLLFYRSPEKQSDNTTIVYAYANFFTEIKEKWKLNICTNNIINRKY